MKMRMKPSCSMCKNFDPLFKQCLISDQATTLHDTVAPPLCMKQGNFIRDMNVMPALHNYFEDGDDRSSEWRQDYTRFSKDADGVPLFVYTQRGVERALPANADVELKGDLFTGVARIMTFQGQREAIRELGVELASLEAEKNGVTLTILDGEELEEGLESYKSRFSGMNRKKSSWVKEATEDGMDW